MFPQNLFRYYNQAFIRFGIPAVDIWIFNLILPEKVVTPAGNRYNYFEKQEIRTKKNVQVNRRIKS